jgi:hypothetical protein
LPAKGEEGWVGLTLIFSDVGWKDGIPGFYTKLDAKSGEVLSAVRGVGLSGRPSSAAAPSGWCWRDAKAKPPPTPRDDVKLDDGKSIASVRSRASEGGVHGTPPTPRASASPCRQRRDDALRIFSPDALEKPRTIDLK